MKNVMFVMCLAVAMVAIAACGSFDSGPLPTDMLATSNPSPVPGIDAGTGNKDGGVDPYKGTPDYSNCKFPDQGKCDDGDNLTVNAVCNGLCTWLPLGFGLSATNMGDTPVSVTLYKYDGSKVKDDTIAPMTSYVPPVWTTALDFGRLDLQVTCHASWYGYTGTAYFQESFSKLGVLPGGGKGCNWNTMYL